MAYTHNAQQFYNLLRSDILGKTGHLAFTLDNLSVRINSKDSIGHMLQEWVNLWANQKNIYLRPNEHTQSFPDFYLSDSNIHHLLEIKSFDAEASPNFDIANFETYVRSILEVPTKLDAHYLVFGYSLNDGVITIEDLWLKQIWELSTSSAQWDLKIQQKQGTIYNIRPVNFTSTRQNIAQPFKDKQEFLLAIQSVLNSYDKTKLTHKNWLNNFKESYYDDTGISLW